MTRAQALKRFLRPQSLAVVGGRFAEAVIRQSDLMGFKGEIYPVNARRKSMLGRSCYAAVSDLPVSPDAAFVAVDRLQSIAVIKDLAHLGTGGVVAYAAGFAELDEQGASLQAELVAAKAETVVLGPNCYGMLNYLDGIALWPDEHGGKAVSKGAGIVLQSGNIGVNITMQQRSLPLAYVVSLGNQADLQMHDYVEAFLDDERITCIGLHIEGLSDIAAFSQVALKALARAIPIVVLKTGASERGQQLALSHTSSLAGSDELYSSFFARYGISRTHTLSEFLETLKFLSTVGPLATKSIASLSCSGGEAALVADLATATGLELAPLLAGQRQALAEVLGDKVHLANPLDYHTYIWNDEVAQQACFAAMMQGEQAITLKILDYPKSSLGNASAWDKTARAFQRALKQSAKKGVVVSTLPENIPEQTRAWLLAEGLAPMQGLEQCLLAIRHAHNWFEAQQRLPDVPALAKPSLKPGIEQNLDEFESKQLLAHFGLLLPSSSIISLEQPEAAEHVCERLGYPLVLKVLSATIAHKTELGGVKLNLQNFAEVHRAMLQMQQLSSSFLVEEMLEPPLLELFLGLSRDQQFGLSLSLGAGGILVELLKDSQTLLLPLDQAEISQALQSLKSYPLLGGFRGRPKAALEPVTNAVLALAKLAETYRDSLLDVDINPLFVYKDRVVVADAFMRIVR